jgi:hypothetical protein
MHQVQGQAEERSVTDIAPESRQTSDAPGDEIHWTSAVPIIGNATQKARDEGRQNGCRDRIVRIESPITTHSCPQHDRQNLQRPQERDLQASPVHSEVLKTRLAACTLNDKQYLEVFRGGFQEAIDVEEVFWGIRVV